jgi:hypothetical protein
MDKVIKQDSSKSEVDARKPLITFEPIDGFG